MQRITAALSATLALLAVAQAHAAQSFAEGTHYVLLHPTQHTSVPAGKVEVMEVFSYGCPACNTYQPVINLLRGNLPANAQMVYLPASFNAGEDWPMFQRAYFAADALGIAERTHQAMYDAIWKTGELATFEPNSHRLKSKQPTLEEAARSYARLTGVQPEAFLAAAKSFTVDMKVKAADAQVLAMEVPGTPCIVVNGKYRVIMDSVKPDQLVELVKYLVARESH